MKRYLSSSLFILTAATLVGLLIHTTNKSSVAHANIEIDRPVPPMTKLADSLRQVSLALDEQIMELHAIDSTLGTHMHLGVESTDLVAFRPTLGLPPDNYFGSVVPDASRMSERIGRQEIFIDSINSHLAERRRMIDQLPTMAPCEGRLSSGFGKRMHPIDSVWKNHTGLDFAAQQGSPILAAGGGVVCYSGTMGGYGNVIEIDHGFGYHTRYAHCSALMAKLGDTVRRGDLVGLVGTTGKSTGPHLHFEMIVDSIKVDPLNVIRDPMPAFLADAAETKALKYTSARDARQARESLRSRITVSQSGPVGTEG